MEDMIDLTGTVIEFSKVTKRFGGRVGVDDVSFRLRPGVILGVVGESGSGKTTCIRMAVGLDRPSSGRILFHGRSYPRSRRSLRPIRRQLGFVFQDPYDSLDPRLTIGDIVTEPLRVHGVHGRTARQQAAAALAAVGLPDAPLDSYPIRYSGGGRQRIAIARALVLDPEVLLCDEPTASLDVSVQAQIINLLLAIRSERELSMIFVSHDLDLIRRVSTDILVMYAGRIVEAGPVDIVVKHPRHPYTRSLLDAIPGDHPNHRKIVVDEHSSSSGRSAWD